MSLLEKLSSSSGREIIRRSHLPETEGLSEALIDAGIVVLVAQSDKQ